MVGRGSNRDLEDSPETDHPPLCLILAHTLVAALSTTPCFDVHFSWSFLNLTPVETTTSCLAYTVQRGHSSIPDWTPFYFLQLRAPKHGHIPLRSALSEGPSCAFPNAQDHPIANIKQYPVVYLKFPFKIRVTDTVRATG